MRQSVEAIEVPMSTPRKHHFVPKFYLKGFTKDASVDGRLWVLNTENRKFWQSTPARTARECDFYRADLGADVDPMWFERALGNVVEPQMAQVLAFILDTKQIPPCGLARDVFLSLVATSLVRGRAMRELISHLVDADIRRTLGELAGSNATVAEAIADAGMSADEFIDLNKQGVFKYDVDRGSYLKAMIDQYNLALRVFARRDWTVRIVADGAPDLICSDVPVGLVALAKDVPLVWFDPNALVVMPLSRNVAAIGSGKDVEQPERLGTVHVARINATTIGGASQAYCSEPAFTVVNGGRCQRVVLRRPGNPDRRPHEA